MTRHEPPKRRDPRDLPSYSAREAAHALALPVSTVRVWSVGDAGGMKPLLRPASASPLALSFWNVVEVYVLASMRRRHRIAMPRVRRALSFVQKKLEVDRPLLHAEFLTDGVDLFVQEYGLVNVSQGGQRALRDVLTGSLQRIERDGDGLALRLFPWLKSTDEPRSVELNPSRAFGRLVVAGTSIPTEALAERFRRGDSVDLLAEDYGLGRDAVEAALRWEQCGLAA